MIPEPATVIEVGENKYQIEYDKKVFGKKWVIEKQIKKCCYFSDNIYNKIPPKR